jgi:hypothetical protein
MYYVSASPSSHEFRTTIKSQIGPRGATLQQKQGEDTPSFVMIIRLCQCSICTSATTVRARASDKARAETMQDS